MSSIYNKIIAKGIEVILQKQGVAIYDLYHKILPEFEELGNNDLAMQVKIKGVGEEMSPEELVIVARELDINPIKIFFVGLAKLRGEDREKKERDLIDIALKLASRLAIYKKDIPAFEKISLKELGDEYSNEELEIVRELAVKLAQTEAIKKLQNI